MNGASSSSPTSSLFGAKGDDASDALLDKLVERLGDDPTSPIPREAEDEWVNTLAGLAEFFASFPVPGEFDWVALTAHRKEIGVALNVVHRLSCKKDAVYILCRAPECNRKVFCGLFKLSSTLEVWSNAAVGATDQLPAVELLKRETRSAFVAFMRCLGENFCITSKAKESACDILRSLLNECLALVEESMSSPPPGYPVVVIPFSVPRQCSMDMLPSSTKSDMAIFTHAQFSVWDIALISLQMFASSVVPPIFTIWFLKDLIRKAFMTITRLDDHLQRSLPITAAPKRYRYQAKLIDVAALLASADATLDVVIQNMIYQRLLARLQDETISDLSTDDSIVAEAIKRSSSQSADRTRVASIVTAARAKKWRMADASLHSCLTAYLEMVLSPGDDVIIEAVEELVQIQEHPEDWHQLTQAVQACRSRCQLVAVSSDITMEDDNGITNEWRTEVKTLLGEIVKPKLISWMEHDTTVTDDQYAVRALNELQDRFTQPLHDSTAHGRLDLADKLKKLAHVLARGRQQNGDERDFTETGDLAIVSSLAGVIESILYGTEEDVTPTVRCRVFDALSSAVQHHISQNSDDEVALAGGSAILGLYHKNRSVRLSAGRVLAQICLRQSSESNISKHVQQYFDVFHAVLNDDQQHWHEDVVVTAAYIGKSASGPLLGKVVFLLVSQLGKSNLVIRGTSYLQLQGIAKYKKTSHYKLVSPYFPEIAPFLVLRLCTEPGLIAETARLLLTNISSLVSSTLAFTLPPVFANCDAKVLQKIGETVGKKPSALFLANQQHTILAHAFLLQGPSRTQKALNFIIKVLQEDSGSDAINVQQITKFCVIQLIGELVVVMGEEEEARSKAAAEALRKVARVLGPSQHAQRLIGKSEFAPLLTENMLGTITYLNDLLQDVQGRKPVQAKRGIMRSLGRMIAEVGEAASAMAPQAMATMQTSLLVPQLADITLDTWEVFARTLKPSDLAPHVGPTSALFIAQWSSFSAEGRIIARRTLEYITCEVGGQLGSHLDELVNMETIPELVRCHQTLLEARRGWSPTDELSHLLERLSSDNLTVAVQSLTELKAFMQQHEHGFIQDLASGDVFITLSGEIVSSLFTAGCREGEGAERLRLLAFECMGIIGALDPDRLEMDNGDKTMIVLSNFTNEDESIEFALHLIRDVLVGAFRSTSEIKYQGLLAYVIQELLAFCKFTTSLVIPGSSAPLKAKRAWNSLPKHVLETVSPLLGTRYTVTNKALPEVSHPIYLGQSTYREWIQHWTAYLITRCSGQRACSIFEAFRAVVAHKDVGVAHRLLPHLVLNIMISGSEEESLKIRAEMIAVLQDQVDAISTSSTDKKQLSAQVIFMLVDHLNKWVRIVRQEVSRKKNDSKRSKANVASSEAEEQLLRVDSILSNIDQDLMAQAALKCKAYALSLMNFERRIVTLRERSTRQQDLQGYYDRLHQIYAFLDEPDGMEGVSTMIISPTLEHQIRQHESTGRWTAAQSCWEVRLQKEPDNLDFHLGLLRCLRNLGHHDTLRTHVKGVLTRYPDWETDLAGFQAESSWLVGDWEDVQGILTRSRREDPAVVMARVLMAFKTGNDSEITPAVSAARSILGAPITASGPMAYRRSYDALVNLHLIHELEMIRGTLIPVILQSDNLSPSQRRKTLTRLSKSLSARLDATLPNFRTREPILSLRRTAFRLMPQTTYPEEQIARSWLVTAKNARKAGHWQTAYSALLQAQQSKSSASFMESAKLIRATGEPLRALQELENAMHVHGLIGEDVILVDAEEEEKRIQLKALTLRARWMNDSERFEFSQVLEAFNQTTKNTHTWESAYYHVGRFYDECYKVLSPQEQIKRGLRMNLQTVRNFTKAIKLGSKYVYQTVPRILTLWLDMGENPETKDTDIFDKIHKEVQKAIISTPVYKWYTAFPQIVSRVGHENQVVYGGLAQMIGTVIQEFPAQALWLFASVVKSTKPHRERRGQAILNQLRTLPGNAGGSVPSLINQSLAMTNELLALCDHPIKEDPKRSLSMRDFPRLAALAPSNLIIPLQESLTANLPPTSSTAAGHRPFPVNAPKFQRFFDEIEVMKSLARPRKITIAGDDGQVYMFLGKPKDDLRKDARLMDFNAIINKLLKANSESRRRQLHIRTYGVVTLNEECGFIQWVPNTIPLRPILIKHYDSRGVRAWSSTMAEVFQRIKDAKDKEAAQMFTKEILSAFPPVFHEWFIETFPEPSAWLVSRLAYGRTAAVMSMVGFILGLGDRHCENILLDMVNGDVVHVDFNCLFEKGKTLETPERVPFRLSQNIVDGLGVTGVEGVFRIACEVTMQLLRDNKDTLMSVLDAFVHDPLVEWEDEKRKQERAAQRQRTNAVRSTVNLQQLAKSSLSPIEKKLRGVYSSSKEKYGRPREKEVTTSNLVEMLIQESTDLANLAKMYPGWGPWH